MVAGETGSEGCDHGRMEGRIDTCSRIQGCDHGRRGNVPQPPRVHYGIGAAQWTRGLLARMMT